MFMMEEENCVFDRPEDEAKYFRKLAEEYKQRLRETQQELEEFQESSRELEAELEAQLEQAETRNKELRSLNSRLQRECEALQEKLEKIHQDTNTQITDLQNELAETKKDKEQLLNYVRELEQSNDDLERAKRTTVSSLEDFEARLNQAIERNAFLESELDEKEALAMMVQRLKDEARDLRQELIIQQSLHKSGTCGHLLHPPDNDRKIEKIPEMDSNKLTAENETQTGSPLRVSTQLSSGSTPLTPAARISALNIVGDLLRKVGALESKLASCRNFVKDGPPRIEKEDVASPVTSPSRVKHLTKSSSLSSPQDCIPLTA